jgi:hypothetical protein
VFTVLTMATVVPAAARLLFNVLIAYLGTSALLAVVGVFKAGVSALIIYFMQVTAPCVVP